MYGNWCGPKYGSGTPIDSLDACCKGHDKCYDAEGHYTCGCDRLIVGCLDKVQLTAQDSDVKHTFRALALGYFKNLSFCKLNNEWTWSRMVSGGR